VNFKDKLQIFRSRTEEGLKRYVPLDPETPARLDCAMKYSLFAGGKRIRPVILLSLFEMEPSEIDPIPAAVAIECLHTYSLIHDDLPSMDDSELRRGVPTCHVAFDEATAVLAGDALLTLAFEILASQYTHEPRIACDLVAELSYAAGSSCLVGGQMDDVFLEKHDQEQGITLADITRIEDHKTGALFKASLRMALILAKRPAHLLNIASDLGEIIGRSFQIVDDILDASGDEKTVGKSLNSDQRNSKITAVSHYGLKGACAKVDELNKKGIELCSQLGKTPAFLIELLEYLKTRVN
jgi:geranylgeranyl diphosphate synthase, type II